MDDPRLSLKESPPEEGGRLSRLGMSSLKDFEFEFFAAQTETDHSTWFGKNRMWEWFKNTPDNTLWNIILCIYVVYGIVVTAGSVYAHSDIIQYTDIVYNVVYGLHCMAAFYEYRKTELIRKTLGKKVGFLIDCCSYIHYPVYYTLGDDNDFTYLLCVGLYYVRLHRPMRYLWALTEENMKGSVMGMFLKYMYLFIVARITFAIFFMYNNIGNVSTEYDENLLKSERHVDPVESRLGKFFLYIYVIDKIFLPIGPDIVVHNTPERLAMLTTMLSGSLLSSGAAVASLSLTICLYLRPEEHFRARFKLIMDDISTSGMPKPLRDKVKTFYEMYWLKQKCVSVTQLMPIFPPTLPASIYTDIYFEGFQKSPILKDLSYPFLWEISKVMSTIHYIPGDAIINRGSKKCEIIYLDYGDMEMVSAEDDDTPLLRMTRGSIITSCGGAMAVACTTSHVQIRAATYCIAHVLSADDLWRVASKYGKLNGQTFIILSSFEEIIQKVKRHYLTRSRFPVKFKSSIVQFKRNVLAMKDLKTDKGKLLSRDDYFLCIAGTYVLRNSSDYEETDDICLRPIFPCIFKPTSSFLFAWHILTASLIMVVTLHYPYQILYKGAITRGFRFFDNFVTVIYVLDLYIHLSTGHHVEEGMPVTFFNTSAKQVMDPWFALDVVATVPILLFIGRGEFSGLNKLLRLPKCFRVLKLMQDKAINQRTVMRFLSYCIMVFFICYLIGAYHQGVVCYIENRCIVSNFTHPPHWRRGTPDLLLKTSVSDRLYFAIFFSISITTFTSTSKPHIYKAPLKTLVMGAIVLEISCIVAILIHAAYSANITVTSAMRYEYDACIENVKSFLVRNRLNPLLRHRFIRYLQLCWYTDKAYAITNQKRNILFDLPPHVYQDIMTRQRIQYILCVPFMNFVNQEELKIVASHMRLFYTSPNEILLNTGDVNNEIYIISRGFCEVYDPDSKTVVGLLGVKRNFGILECLMRCPAFYTVRAVTHVQIFSVARKHLMTILEMPHIKTVIESVKTEKEFKNIFMRRDPFLEYHEPDLPTNKQSFPLPRKHIPDTAFLYPFAGLGFMSVLRYVVPRFTIRPDGKYIMRYEMFRGVCAYTSAMIYPSFTYLSLQWPSLYYCTWFLDLSAYLDILQRLLVGYYDSKGILVYHPASTATHYIKGPFIIDLLACLPLEYLEISHMDSANQKGKTSYYLSEEVKQLLMLNRLIQLYRMVSAMEFINNYVERRDVILVIKAIPMLTVALNVVTCLVILHSVNIYGPPNYTDGPWLIVIENDPGGSWLELFNNVFGFDQVGSPWNLHITVYFFVVSMMISTGYGVFAPSSRRLLVIFTCGMFTSAMMITFFSVLVISTRSNVNKVLATFQGNLRDIIVFMRREKLHEDLQKDLLDYYEYNWERMGGSDYREVLKLCDQITLRTDAILHIYGRTFSKCPIVQHCDMSLLRVLGRAVYNLYFLKNTVIIEIDDVITDLFIIDYGEIDLIDYTGAFSSVHKLSVGSIFGNLDARPTYRCVSKVLATSNVHLLQINSLSFHTIIADFPTVSVFMKKHRPNKENFIIGNENFEMSPVFEQRSPSYTQQNKFQHETNSFVKIISHLSADRQFIQVYLIIVCLMGIYCDVYNAGFQSNSHQMIIILYVMDFLFMVKIILFLLVPSLMNKGELKSNMIDSRNFYIKDEFKSDLFSLLPIEFIGFLFGKNEWEVFSTLRLNRMIRCKTIHKSLQRVRQKLSVNLVLTTIVAVAIWFTVFIHCTACLWYVFGSYEEGLRANSSWMTNLNGIECDNMYVCSLFFVLTTFTSNGVKDIIPQQCSEILFAVFVQVTSSLIFMVYVGEFSNIIQYMSFRAFSFYSQFLELQEFMKNNHVSSNLVDLVNRYTLHLWRETRGLQVPRFLDSAPQCFKLRIMTATYMRLLKSHPYFRVCEQTFLRQLVGCLQMYTYCEGIFVVKQGEITDAMYLVHRGEIEEVFEEFADTGRRGIIYRADENFGSKNGLLRDLPYAASYRAISDSHVLTLQLDCWEYLLRHFPRSRYLIYKNIPDHPFGREDLSQKSEEENDVVETVIQNGSSYDIQTFASSTRRRRSTIYGAYLPFTENVSSRRQTTVSVTPEAITEQPTSDKPEYAARQHSVESFKDIEHPTFVQKMGMYLNEVEDEEQDKLQQQEEEAAATALIEQFESDTSEFETDNKGRPSVKEFRFARSLVQEEERPRPSIRRTSEVYRKKGEKSFSEPDDKQNIETEMKSMDDDKAEIKSESDKNVNQTNKDRTFVRRVSSDQAERPAPFYTPGYEKPTLDISDPTAEEPGSSRPGSRRVSFSDEMLQAASTPKQELPQIPEEKPLTIKEDEDEKKD